jgi:uncharacterized membrane protein
MNIHTIEELLSQVIFLAVLILEIFGATIILFAGTSTFIRFLLTSKDGRDARLTFARFLVFGLEFKLAGEILRTVVVRSIKEVSILAAVIALRAVLNLIVHWEIRQEKQDRD